MNHLVAAITFVSSYVEMERDGRRRGEGPTVELRLRPLEISGDNGLPARLFQACLSTSPQLLRLLQAGVPEIEELLPQFSFCKLEDLLLRFSNSQMEGSHKIVDEAESRSKEHDSVPIVDVEEDEEEVAENKGGHKTSWVWQHFDKNAIKKGVEKVKCPYCPQMMCANSKKNGTSAMGNHLKLYCAKSPVYNPSLGKSGDSKKQSVLSFKKGE
ncbi:hypothetical protein LXL04_034870 [Taraxacum kok-saghyz]